MVTKYFKNNKKYETVGAGELTVIKDIGLREIYMSVVLPNDLSLPFVQQPYVSDAKVVKPIEYLVKFRDFKLSKKPVQLLVTRILPDGDEIFKTNILLTLEEYTVYEKALENGDFIVDLIFREYKNIDQQLLSVNASSYEASDNSYTQSTNRTSKDTPSTYTVQKGDTLWMIAKKELNNELLYKDIMSLNNITEPRNLQIGTVLKLP